MPKVATEMQQSARERYWRTKYSSLKERGGQLLGAEIAAEASAEIAKLQDDNLRARQSESNAWQSRQMMLENLNKAEQEQRVRLREEIGAIYKERDLWHSRWREQKGVSRGLQDRINKLRAEVSKLKGLNSAEGVRRREIKALSLRKAGKTFREMAEVFGVSVERARGIYYKALKRDSSNTNPSSHRGSTPGRNQGKPY